MPLITIKTMKGSSKDAMEKTMRFVHQIWKPHDQWEKFIDVVLNQRTSAAIVRFA